VVSAQPTMRDILRQAEIYADEALRSVRDAQRRVDDANYLRSLLERIERNLGDVKREIDKGGNLAYKIESSN
jgi:hypothetical protein